MEANAQVRIDQWLWAVRIFKTRTQAADECKKSRVIIDGIVVKPSRIVKIGDVIMVKKTPIIYTYKVTGIIDTRVAFAIAQQNYVNLTPDEEITKLQLMRISKPVMREKGTGRPTKKDRRELDDIFEY